MIYRLLLIINMVLITPEAFAAQTKLDCSFTNYSRSGYQVDIAKSWVPARQIHEIDDHQIFWGKFKNDGPGMVKVNTPDKIKWTYVLSLKARNSLKQDTIYNYTYFRTTNKVVVTVKWTANWKPIEGIWGECTEKNHSTINAGNSAQKDKSNNVTLNEDEGYILVGGNEYYDIYVSEELGKIKILGDARHYNNFVDIMEDDRNPTADMALYFTNENPWDFKKYKLKYLPTEKLVARKINGIRTLEVESNYISGLLNPTARYFFLSLENKGNSRYYWFVTNDIEATCFRKKC